MLGERHLGHSVRGAEQEAVERVPTAGGLELDGIGIGIGTYFVAALGAMIVANLSDSG